MLLITGSFLFMVLNSCTSKVKNESLFTKLPADSTGIHFSNDVRYNEEFNPYIFRNFYNGGGIGIGDINNDGLPDLFFCSNQGGNKLYLNKGDFHFEDITAKSGILSNSSWSTGVSMADVNGDGWLDIYVCKSGDTATQGRSNELYINQGNLTFLQKAREYGLDNRGLSTHAAFFDYDRDGDLDCYLLTNSLRSVVNYDQVKDERTRIDSVGGNKLFRNDGDHFTDVTSTAGIYSSKIGFGLGVTISDINKDGWADIYVSNDFFERDYLYINLQNGKFKESAEQCIGELSMNAMGADIADINNDGNADIYVTDMFPQQEERIKTKTTFENWDKYQSNVSHGYYKQFVRNTLQLNLGSSYNQQGMRDASFSEIGRFSGVSATDWSWGALITDLDNDGYKDVFVANGIAKDITDQDYIQYTSSGSGYSEIRQQILNHEKNVITRLIDLIPSEAIPNYAFRNKGDLTFENKAEDWGLGEASFSNGSAYGDLDGDGDLDLVVNNVNMPCFVYRNEAVQQHPENRFLKVTLEGEGKNRFGTGSKVTVWYNRTEAYQEQMPMRGFESTVDCCLNFGLGKCEKIDSVVVEWNDGRRSVLKEVKPNQHLVVHQQEAVKGLKEAEAEKKEMLFNQATDSYGLDFIHQENAFIDFNRDRLIFHMLSTQGPRIAKGDINKDGLEDIYICGAKDQAGVLYQQTAEGRFIPTNERLLEADKGSEDTDALFFDCDGDGDEDLYVCSGGSEFGPQSLELLDRLYINDGKGLFKRSAQVLPSYNFESSSCVRASDYDGDGDLDLFVGIRLKPLQYGYPCKGYILQNNGKGMFSDVTAKTAPSLMKCGMITDAEWIDYDKDGRPDLAVTGEYMPVKLLHNEGTGFKEVTKQAGLEKTNGWWNRLIAADVNGDGYMDLIGGNHGLNSRFKATAEKPVSMYVSDFDENGSVEQVITCYNGEKSYPMALRHDLVQALPYLKKKYLKYAEYKLQTIEDVFTSAQLKKAERLDAYEMRSCVFINDKKGGFTLHPLNSEAQLSPVYGIAVKDIDGDGKVDIVLGGNFYESKPEAGIYDASYGTVLKGDGNGSFQPMSSSQSGLHIRGAVRDMIWLNHKEHPLLLIAKNNAHLQLEQLKP